MTPVESYVRLAASELYPGQTIPDEMIADVTSEIESHIEEVDWEEMWDYTRDSLATYVNDHALNDLRQQEQLNREESYHKALGEVWAIIRYLFSQADTERRAHEIYYWFQRYRDTQYVNPSDPSGNMSLSDMDRAWQEWYHLSRVYAKLIGLESLGEDTMRQVAHYIKNNEFRPFEKTR